MTPDLFEAVAVAEEVAAAGEIAGTVDLSTISQQLDQILLMQHIIVLALGVVAGVILGVILAQVVRELWK